jgi:hypothetical protein
VAVLGDLLALLQEQVGVLVQLRLPLDLQSHLWRQSFYSFHLHSDTFIQCNLYKPGI